MAPLPEGGLASPHPAPRRRWTRRVGIVVLVVLALGLGAFGAFAFVAKQEIDDFVTPETAAMKKAAGQLEAPLPGKPTNILLLGSDHRANSQDPSDRRSDTMLLVRLDPKRKSISMLSFPRDLWVPIPGKGEAKINDAYTYGGPSLSVQTIKELTGLDINFVMNVDFAGFRGVVNTLGGVYVDVDRTYFNAPGTGFAPIDLKPGYQRLMGEDALQYARFRHDGRGDFNRIARQQLVLAALKKQVSASTVASNVRGLFKVLNDNTEVVGGGGGGVPARVLYDYMRLALELDGKDVYQVDPEWNTGEVPVGGIMASVVVYDEATMEAAVEAFLAPDPQAREASADQLVGARRPSAEAGDARGEEEPASAPEPSDVSIDVRNGSGTDGAARAMADQLRGAGYEVTVQPGAAAMADNVNYANTRVQYRRDGDRAAAEALADRIEGATAERSSGAMQFDTQLLVVVGKSGTKVSGAEGAGPAGTDDGPDGGEEYDGNVVPPKAAAKVVRDPEYGREDFASLPKLPFPVLYPTVREETSSYEELHHYSLQKGKATYRNFRLVAQTAQGDYWGLQATSWPDPPILEEPTREETRRGRTYKLYFNGTKLHMVAWRQGSANYWVTNSILDSMSNETMLAIAEGVRAYR